jgi:hypothetical protein
MFSLPSLPPPDDLSSWLRPVQRPRSDSPPPNGQTHQQTHRQRQLRDEEKRLFNARSPLALLAADEHAIEQRKAAVRNFGAYWIRPPGLPKTLQAMTEEEAERLEQAEMERQERGLLDMQAQQQLEEARQRAAETEAQAEAGELEEERDLDDDIPDAEHTTADITFNEDSLLNGSQLESTQENDEHYAELEEAELNGAAQDEEDLGLEGERNLDDSIPEAGSYQHTDTEEEDTDSESELQDSLIAPRARQSTTTTPANVGADSQTAQGLQERMRAQMRALGSFDSPGSLRLSSSMHESSFLASSPMARHTPSGPPPRTRGGRRRGG